MKKCQIIKYTLKKENEPKEIFCFYDYVSNAWTFGGLLVFSL